MRPRRIWLERATGLWIGLLFAAMGLGLFSQEVADSNQLFGTLARMADSLRPHLLLLSIAMALVLLRRDRVISWICILAALSGMVAMVADYRARVAPEAGQGDLTLLWFNLRYDNDIAVTDLERALHDSGADLVALTETLPARDLGDRLADLYPYRWGDGADSGIMVFSRHPFDQLPVRLPRPGATRFLKLRLEVPDRVPLDLVLVHMSKPWYLGPRAQEQAFLEKALTRDAERPLVVMGDFNAAPWSRGLRDNERRHRLRHVARPVPTWPASIAWLGLPIDHVLLRGTRMHRLQAWGEGLGSNHLGLRVGIKMPDKGDA
ncbi:MAG: endonuclease/exonuclease/phosphatase family protein [Methylocystaceae bacterium]|nr:endonuclease/exonuclease/phosphatase family protein [Methylocystaceae bacterium]